MRHRSTTQVLTLIWVLTAAIALEAGDTDQPAAIEAVSASLATSVELPGLIRLAAARNPAIKAAAAEWRAAIENVPQATALPDPVVRFDYFGESVETRVGPQEYRYGVSQSFPFPGTLRQAGEVASKDVLIKHAEYTRAVRDTIVDLKLRYHELLYLRGAMDITRQNQELLTHILKATNTRFAEGKAKLADVLKAQSQLAQLSYDLVLLRELEAVEQAELAALLDMPATTEIGTLTAPPLSVLQTAVDDVEEAALAHREELRIAEGNVQRTREAIRLAKLRNRPTFTLSGMHIATGEADAAVDDSGKDPWMVGLSVSLPIWPGRNRSRVREAEAREEAAMHGRQGLANKTRAAVRRVYFRLENARRLVELYEKSLIPQAEQAMEAAEQWHDGDVQDISGFLETQTVWLNFNLARLRAATDYQQYLARLEQLAGGRLPAPPAEEEEDK